MFHNIEKSGFEAGAYVGYSAGRVFRIVKQKGAKGWKAFERKHGGATLYGRTLKVLSERLEELDPNSDRAKAQRVKAIAAHASLS